jgi:undecaprenyl diphosphate synthase
LLWDICDLNQNIPHHVAIVMDGNGRWAERRGLPRIEGHRAGVEAVKGVVQCCLEKGISVLSLFAFSSENWQRPEMEVEFLMQLFINALEGEVDSLDEQCIALRFTSERSKLSTPLQAQMEAAETRTSNNQKLILNIAVNYSGKWDILQSVKKIARQIAEGEMKEEDLTESLFDNTLATSGLRDPDLLIRTSGEQRISNFFLWQIAYTELYFTDTHWPDFSSQSFEDALESYCHRERRFGQTSTQLLEKNHV